MRILLTGPTGLVGAALRKALTQQFPEISAVCRNPVTSDTSVEWIPADLSDKEISFRVFPKADVVIHNAATISAGDSSGKNLNMYRLNVEFTERLLQWSADQEIKKFIFTSSFSLLAKPLPGCITEDAAVNPLTPYAASKWAGEELVRQYSGKYNFEHFIFRISSPVCAELENMPDTVVRKWIEQSMKGQTISITGTGSRTQDFVGVEDIASAFVNAVNSENRKGLYNIASGTSLSLLDLAKMITDRFGNSFELKKDLTADEDRYNISIEKAKKELNYNPSRNSQQVISHLIKNIG